MRKGQVNQNMNDANTAPSAGDGKIKHADDKAFITRNAVCTGTTFVPEKMTTTKIQFGSVQYFDLLAQHPDWYKYVAVGQQVIFVVNGVAYEITPAS